MFLHNYYPSPVILKLGPFAIHWYGLLIVLGMLSGFFITLNLVKKYGIPKDYIYNLTFYLIIFGFTGARFYHVLTQIDYYRQNLLEIFKIWQGGLAMHGALIAGAVVVWVYSKISPLSTSPPQSTYKSKSTDTAFDDCPRGSNADPDNYRGADKTRKKLRRGESFWFLANFLTPAVLTMHIFVRLGNWFNQELYGRPTSLPWGIPIALANRMRGYESYLYFHPTFLYEIIFCLGLFLFLVWLYKIELKGIIPQQQFSTEKKNKNNKLTDSFCLFINNGSIFLIYLISYSTIRFFLEFIRIDPEPLVLGLRLAQIVSILVTLFSAVILTTRSFKNPKNPKF